MSRTIALRGGYLTNDPRLDAIPLKDPRSRAYPALAAVDLEQPLRSASWRMPTALVVDPLDQGREGACVEFGIANELAARPVMVPVQTVRAITANHAIYWPAQHIDPWEGGAYPGATPAYDGTALVSGLTVARDLGYFDEFRWIFEGASGLMRAMVKGPAVLAIPWYTGMFRPDSDGRLHVTGSIEGWHCISALKSRAERWRYRDERNRIVVWNSWGRREGWPEAHIVRDDMDRLLLGDRGEAAIVVGRHRGLTA